ncbi:CotH kinase family protein [Candidatus Sumerlaeota bacterium]|nr:CotH kinase family protein [Candidatus Sumerlaeota bacterium]
MMVGTRFRAQGPALLLMALLAAALPAQGEIAINCGSAVSAEDAPDGLIFSPDQPYIAGVQPGYEGGTIHTLEQVHVDTMGGTENNRALYAADRVGWTAYRFDVPPDLYAVQLHLMETEHHFHGRRVISIAVEGISVIENLDIWDQVRLDYAFPICVSAEVTDGTLDVTSTASVGETILSGISVVSVSPESVAPAVPEGFDVIGGYEMNILNWDPVPEADLWGYNICCQADGGSIEQINTDVTRVTRYLDTAVTTGVPCSYAVTSVDLWGNESAPTSILQAAALEHTESSLPVYELEISESALAQLTADIWAEEYVPALFRFEGREWEVEVRFRGHSTRDLDKKNWKIRFPAGDLFFGRRKLNLQSEMIDSSMLIDRLGYAVCDSAGSLTPHTEPVHLVINGEFAGVYLSVEQIDEHFLAARGLDTTGTIYQMITTNLQALPSPELYIEHYELETNEETADHSDITALTHLIDDTPDSRIGGALLAGVNLESVFAFYAANNAVADPDDIFNNTFLLNDPLTGRWQWINWDHTAGFVFSDLPLNSGTQAQPSPIGTGAWNHIFNRVMTTPHLRRAHLLRQAELSAGLAHPDAMNALIDAYHAEIEFDALRDPHKGGREDPGKMEYITGYLGRWIGYRNDYVTAQLPLEMPDLGPAAALLINEVVADGLAAQADEMGDFDPWIEILNTGDTAVDLAGLHITDDASDLTRWTFPTTVIIPPGGRALVWADGEPAEGPLHTGFTLLPSGGADLTLAAADGVTILSQIALPALGPDESLSCYPDGRLNMIRAESPTPLAVNTGPAQPLSLLLNEIMTLNGHSARDEHGETDAWLEIFSEVGAPVILDGMGLTNDLGQPGLWPFPAGTQIEANGHLVVWLDGETGDGPLHTSFAVSPEAGVIALHRLSDGYLIDQIAHPDPTVDVSHGRFPDGASTLYAMPSPTPGAPNVLSTPSGLVINELLASNDSFGQDETGAFEDWVEIHNPTATPLSAGGMWLTDSFDNLMRWQIPTIAETTIPPGGHLLIWADDDNNPPDGPLHTSFKLSAAGEEVALVAADGVTVIDSVVFGAQVTDVAWARFPDGGSVFVPTALPTPEASNSLTLTLSDMVDALLGQRTLSVAEQAEADVNGDGVLDAADLVERLWLGLP